MAIVEDLIGLTRPRGGALSPIRNQRLLFEATSSVKIRVFSLIYALVVQPEADRGLKILPVWVRIPSRVPAKFGSIVVGRQSGKTLDVSDRRIRNTPVSFKGRTADSKSANLCSNQSAGAIETRTAIIFKEQTDNLQDLTMRLEVNMGRWRTGLARLTENQRTSVRLGPVPPYPRVVTEGNR